RRGHRLSRGGRGRTNRRTTTALPSGPAVMPCGPRSPGTANLGHVPSGSEPADLEGQVRVLGEAEVAVRSDGDARGPAVGRRDGELGHIPVGSRLRSGDLWVWQRAARRVPPPLEMASGGGLRGAHEPPGPRAVYGKLTNRSLKSVAFAAPPSIGVTPKISSTVRSVELWS